MFIDLFPLQMEFLFGEDDLKVPLTTFSSTKATKIELINALVEPTKCLILIEDTKTLLVDIKKQLSNISIVKQGSNQNNQVKVVSLVEIANLVKIRSIPDNNNKNISSFL